LASSLILADWNKSAAQAADGLAGKGTAFFNRVIEHGYDGCRTWRANRVNPSILMISPTLSRHWGRR
jgi:hypothetical protein